MKDRIRSTKHLRAAVVGGGIGGLSAACALSRRGIDVMVFEQAETLGEIGAGLTIFPNSLRQSLFDYDVEKVAIAHLNEHQRSAN